MGNLFETDVTTDCTCTHRLLIKAGFKKSDIAGHHSKCPLSKFKSIIPKAQS